MDQLGNLRANGYEMVIGLRDLYPHTNAELAGLEQGLAAVFPAADFDVRTRIVVREIEAWFLQEWLHYERVDASLTVDVVNATIGEDVDIRVDSVEYIVEHPAKMLDKVYRRVGKKYNKKRFHTANIIYHLDYANIYTEVRALSVSLNRFLDDIDNFLAPMREPG